MKVYIREQEGNKLIELGKILKIETNKIGTFIITGDYNEHTVIIKLCEDEKEAKTIFNEMISRIVQPTAREVEKGIIYIDLG